MRFLHTTLPLSLVLVVLTLLVIGTPAHTQACTLARAPKVARLVSTLAKTDSVIRAWSGYDPKKIPTLLIDLSVARDCVFVVQNGELREARQLEAPLELNDSGGHDFIVNPQNHPDYPGLQLRSVSSFIEKNGWIRCCDAIGNSTAKRLLPLLQEHQLPAAMVFWLPEDNGGFLTSDYGIGLRFSILIHEMFHFFYQNRGLSQQAWPQKEMPAKISHTDYPAVCHTSNANIRELSARETQALLAAYEARRDRATLIARTREFLRLRKLRWESIGELPASVRNGSTYKDCHDLDGYHELLEGAAQFAGDFTALQTGLMKEEWLEADSRQRLLNLAESDSKSTAQYDLGSVQLFLLAAITGKDFEAATARLAGNTNGGTITDALDEAAGKP